MLEKRKSGKYQDIFASKYKITQNPTQFDGTSKGEDPGNFAKTMNTGQAAFKSRNFNKRARSVLQSPAEKEEMLGGTTTVINPSAII